MGLRTQMINFLLRITEISQDPFLPKIELWRKAPKLYFGGLMQVPKLILADLDE